MNVCQINTFPDDYSEIVHPVTASPSDVMLDIRMGQTFIEERSGPEVIDLLAVQKLEKELVYVLVRVVLS
jgi:hypothetical protein